MGVMVPMGPMGPMGFMSPMGPMGSMGPMCPGEAGTAHCSTTEGSFFPKQLPAVGVLAVLVEGRVSILAAGRPSE